MDAPMEKLEMEKQELDPDLSDSDVYIFDRRTSGAPEIKLKVNNATTYQEFREGIRKALKINTNEFVISTTSREEINGESSWGNIERGDTFYILNDIDQDLCDPAQERVNYLPHYDTIVKGGMYEYYASEGQNPLRKYSILSQC
ncbi:structural maintenance of chromosomes flexible hinge domain-containing protein 1 [Elysia marginata]|uniref:Structural maintenance of chromosomes flexible hinge domain-containing protein 1 n=1 Tax=Elysia marginata TaxID=1093978 RepID=A0AAV4HLF9_9GAST|nr:structural maintenance of chromosomes flexible hinge domain-containing protein 1 [Elysia marginata]